MINKTDRWRQKLQTELKKTKVVYTDLDNTLLGPQGCLFYTADMRYTLRPAESLVSLAKSGIDVVIISGRNATQLREVSRLLGLKNFIAELGCLISYSNEHEEIFRNYRYPHPIDETLYQAIANAKAPELLLTTYSDRLEYHTPWSKWRECTHLFRGLLDLNKANKLLQKEGFGNLKLIDNGPVRTKGTLTALDEVHAYHLLPTETSKSSAILLDLKTRGLAADETIALGDSLADVDMAAVVGHFFLVGNRVKTDREINNELARYNNVYVTEERMGLGWAEVAQLIVGGAMS